MANMPNMSTRNITLDEAATITGLTRKAIERRIERNRFPSLLVNGRRMVPLSELYRQGLALPGDDGEPKPVPRGDDAGDGEGESRGTAVGTSPPAPVWIELLDRLERQAAQIAEHRLIAAQAETERKAREAAEAALFETRAQAERAEAERVALAERVRELEASMAVKEASARPWWAPWRRPPEASPTAS
jgi:predicted DNA-binding transcriptional regulator AlpA